MLSEAARPYIAASVPVLRSHGLQITQVFYQSLFCAHPELHNLFNLGNQANGVQQQSLAAAVFAYAANIDNAAALAPVIRRIAHKHASVGISARHYPIVGRHLLGAIQTVLREAATPALLAAWEEAYSLLADSLIAAENALYTQADSQAGELRRLTVLAVREESAQVRSYYLQDAEGGSPGSFLPGQYVSVAVQLGELRQLRQYSLSDAPEQPWWRISVKREDGAAAGVAGQVSNWLHRQLQVGDTLLVGRPYGDFAPELGGERPICLISAGVGITPMVSVLNSLRSRHPQRRVLFAHAARHGRLHALRSDLALSRHAHPGLRSAVFYETPEEGDRLGIHYQHAGRMQLAKVLDAELLDGDFYLCGPLGFMQQQWQALLAAGVSPARIQREVFGPELLDQLG
ncbi:globin domain-containing protein [Chitinimonas taiwanensis]|uniref:nitric oxide dioxygenase n=1 Tax=Chitinimonas taiwanensis DSM 18899 TaxID=1121279 RepID=A0A1K2H9Z8_9NEIS|nr:globin domain-containing protein [Chitinimonas taiwanensis]SFZ73684.1 nitric oxide dioxygenase [Chitinimonas taiwanensis DSM 18899]